jgi:hypothetical protein
MAEMLEVGRHVTVMTVMMFKLPALSASRLPGRPVQFCFGSRKRFEGSQRERNPSRVLEAPLTCEVKVTLGQAACILNVATERSLVIVDELGEDTKTRSSILLNLMEPLGPRQLVTSKVAALRQQMALESPGPLQSTWSRPSYVVALVRSCQVV